jgi:hypothetical protein
VQHYCVICDKVTHPTLRCHLLKLHKPTSFVTGSGSDDLFFLQLPDNVHKAHIAPTQSPTALVKVTGGDAVPAEIIQTQVARIFPDSMEMGGHSTRY